MAEKDDKGLIGFDPLAWMDESDENEAKQQTEEQTEIDSSEHVEAVNNEMEVMAETSAEATIENTELPDNEGKLTLDGTLNIQNVSHLYEQLLALLENQTNIDIDASSVVSIDTSTLQLLIVFKQTAIKLGKEVVFDFPSDKFVESAELLGLAEMLEVDQSAAGFF